MMEQIDRKKTLTSEELLKGHILTNKPVILTEAACDWPAIEKWNPAYLKKNFGDEVVFVRGSRVGLQDIGLVKLSEYIGYLLEGDISALGIEKDQHILAPYNESHPVKPYVAYNSNLLNTALSEDIQLHSFLPPGYRFRTSKFWLGVRGTATPLHYDSWGFNIFFQVYGRKRFLIYHPQQTPQLYPSDIFEFNTVYSQVNVIEPDHEKFPRYKDAQGIEIVLKPGEILIIPRCWWHDVQALDHSISVNGWAVTPWDRCSPTYLQNLLKKWSHSLKLYANGRCTCHLSSGQDVGQMLGWYE